MHRNCDDCATSDRFAVLRYPFAQHPAKLSLIAACRRCMHRARARLRSPRQLAVLGQQHTNPTLDSARVSRGWDLWKLDVAFSAEFANRAPPPQLHVRERGHARARVRLGRSLQPVRSCPPQGMRSTPLTGASVFHRPQLG